MQLTLMDHPLSCLSFSRLTLHVQQDVASNPRPNDTRPAAD